MTSSVIAVRARYPTSGYCTHPSFLSLLNSCMREVLGFVNEGAMWLAPRHACVVFEAHSSARHEALLNILHPCSCKLAEFNVAMAMPLLARSDASGRPLQVCCTLEPDTSNRE